MARGPTMRALNAPALVVVLLALAAHSAAGAPLNRRHRRSSSTIFREAAALEPPSRGSGADAPLQRPAAVLGRWKVVDPASGRIGSVVHVTDRGGKYYGRVVELYRLPGESDEPRCLGCIDDRKNAPVLGMDVLRDFAEAPGESQRWLGGTICDPRVGVVSSGTLWIDVARPNVLHVQRKILFITAKVEEWVRE